jgi:hypothetical protein
MVRVHRGPALPTGKEFAEYTGWAGSRTETMLWRTEEISCFRWKSKANVARHCAVTKPTGLYSYYIQI